MELQDAACLGTLGRCGFQGFFAAKASALNHSQHCQGHAAKKSVPRQRIFELPNYQNKTRAFRSAKNRCEGHGYIVKHRGLVEVWQNSTEPSLYLRCKPESCGSQTSFAIYEMTVVTGHWLVRRLFAVSCYFTYHLSMFIT